MTAYPGRRLLLCLLAFLSAAIAMLAYATPAISPLFITDIRKAPERGILISYYASIDYRAWQSSRFLIIPNNCLHALYVNDTPINIKTERSEHLCNAQKGFTFNLAPYLQPGKNDIDAIVFNAGPNDYGLTLWPLLPFLPVPANLFGLGMLCAMMWIYYVALGRRRPALAAAGIIALSLFFTFFLHRETGDYWLYDTAKHKSTIDYYAQHGFPPQPVRGDQSHQPPLFYALAALVQELAVSTGNLWQPVKDMNFFLFSLFLLYGILSIRQAVRHRALQFLGVLAFLYWPANMMHCCRISNDILIYLAFMGCAYHLMRWQMQPDNLKQLSVALIWAGIAFAAKRSAIALLLAVITLLLLHFWRRANTQGYAAQWRAIRNQGHFHYLVIGLMVLAAGITLSYGRNLHWVLTDHDIVESAQRHVAGNVHISPHQYFTLAPMSLIKNPYINMHDTNEENRQQNTYFWNYLIRSMSFGSYPFWNGTTSAKLLNFSLCAIWIGLALLLCWRRFIRRHSPGWPEFYLVFIVFILSAMAYVKSMFAGPASWVDVRYYYAIIPFLLIAYLSALENIKRESRAVYALGIAFVAMYLAAAWLHISLQITHPDIPISAIASKPA